LSQVGGPMSSRPPTDNLSRVPSRHITHEASHHLSDG
jgi:hypothetical protein